MKFMKKIERKGRMCKPRKKKKKRVIKKQVKFWYEVRGIIEARTQVKCIVEGRTSTTFLYA